MLPPPAATKPKNPIARARSAGSVNSDIISDRDTAETIAPPKPWITRAATSTPSDGAMPQAAEATVNSTSPPRNIRR